MEGLAGPFRPPSASLLSGEGVRADLVARRITQVGRIGTRQVTTCARLALVGAACGKAGSMEGIHFGGSGGRKADRHAVAGRRLTIARTGDDDSRLFATEKYPSVVERHEVFDAKSTHNDLLERDPLQYARRGRKSEGQGKR